MKISYDKDVDALYIEISNEKPDGVIEIKEGVNIDVTEDSRIVGLEILNASKKVSLDSFYNYEISPELFRQLA